MPQHPHHSFSNDRLFQQVIEAEIDACRRGLTEQERRTCLRTVTERLNAEISEHLAGADLSPNHLIARIREEVLRAIEPGQTAA